MVNVQTWGESLRLVVELAATAAFALSGVLEAARKRLDAVGVCVVGFLAAFGGGTLRDLLLDQRPYAVFAFLGGWAYVGLWQVNAAGWLALLLCVAITAGLRAVALWRNWELPAWRVQD